MKKICFISLVLALVLSVTGGLADSIFRQLPEEAGSDTILTAPSYSAMANVDPDRTEANAGGGTIVTYSHVEAAGYNSFGAYLGNLGFSVTGEEEQGSRIAYAVSDGQVDFTMIYDQDTKTMQLVYPKGTDWAKALCPGYIRIPFNEEISIPGLGRLTFHDFVLSDKGTAAPRFDRNSAERIKKGSPPYIGEYFTRKTNCWLSFSFFNTSTSGIYYGSNYDRASSLFDATLVYRNADDDYEYPANCSGAFRPEDKLIATYGSTSVGSYFGNQTCDPLTGMEYAAAFDLAPSLRESFDGTIIIKLDFKNGEKYVLVARENGVNLNLFTAPPEQ